MTFPTKRGIFQYDLTDHHAILGVPLGASVPEVRQRYLAIAYCLHPDTCKAESREERRRASQMFSKLVNPAYEQLSKARSRNDYLIVLSQLGKSLAADREKSIIPASELAQKMSQVKANFDLPYRKFLQSLALQQYDNLDAVVEIVAQISELNLVYLLLVEGRNLEEQKKSLLEAAQKNSQGESPQTEVNISPLAKYIRRARECLERGDFNQAVRELRDALKLDPNDSTCHGLLGMTYLKQNQMTMAKVHINKAYQVNPQDPIALAAKQELNKLLPDESQDAETKSGGSWLGGWFGQKKNK